MSTTPMPAPESAGLARTFLDDPFAEWGNDDLNFKPPMPLGSYRDALGKIFAWPELRQLFDTYDSAAKPARQRSRWWGVLAIWLGFAALCAAAFSPLFLQLVADWARETQHDVRSHLRPFEIGLGFFILLTSLASGAIGYGAILRGQEKARWLLNRFWCERLRQLHFQIIVNNLPLAAEALTQPTAMDQFLSLRAEYLELFRENYAANGKDYLEALENDLAESNLWVLPIWEHPAPPQANSPQIDVILTVLRHQRFGIQRQFCVKKLAPGWYSAITRSHFVENASNLLTVVLLGLSIATASIYLLSPDHIVTLLSLAGLGGMFGSCIAAMRVLNEGLQFRADVERYRWYLASIEALQRRFESASLSHKVDVLRDMELTAYQEMRRFIVTVSRSKFVM